MLSAIISSVFSYPALQLALQPVYENVSIKNLVKKNAEK
jgi:hypothetical protein